MVLKSLRKATQQHQKKITHIVKVTTQKANQIIYHEVNISYLYLIN